MTLYDGDESEEKKAERITAFGNEIVSDLYGLGREACIKKGEESCEFLM